VIVCVRKKQNRMWAFGWAHGRTTWLLSNSPYSSEHNFIVCHPNGDRWIWPAKMNTDGTFTEPEND